MPNAKARVELSRQRSARFGPHPPSFYAGPMSQWVRPGQIASERAVKYESATRLRLFLHLHLRLPAHHNEATFREG